MWSKLLCALPFVLFLVAYPGESAEINVAAKPNVDVASVSKLLPLIFSFLYK